MDLYRKAIEELKKWKESNAGLAYFSKKSPTSKKLAVGLFHIKTLH